MLAINSAVINDTISVPSTNDTWIGERNEEHVAMKNRRRQMGIFSFPFHFTLFLSSTKTGKTDWPSCYSNRWIIPNSYRCIKVNLNNAKRYFLQLIFHPVADIRSSLSNDNNSFWYEERNQKKNENCLEQKE